MPAKKKKSGQMGNGDAKRAKKAAIKKAKKKRTKPIEFVGSRRFA